MNGNNTRRAKSRPSHSVRYSSTVALLLAIAVITVMVSWRTSPAPNLPTYSSGPMASASPSQTRLSKEQMQQTRAAVVRAQTRTAVALTPAVDKAPEPPRTPRPTATIALGMLETCGQPLNSRQPHSISCWRGIVNGHIVDVEGGFMIDANHQQYGIVVVNTWYVDDYQVIAPPQRTGPLRIASINGLLFTFAADNPDATRVPYSSPTPYATFTFDLATRQWVSPPTTPGPSPSALISPVPSVSPVPTQSP